MSKKGQKRVPQARKPLYKKGDVIAWNKNKEIRKGITAVITEVKREIYLYLFLTPVETYGKNSTGSYPFAGLEEDTHLMLNPNQIWKELNEQ